MHNIFCELTLVIPLENRCCYVEKFQCVDEEPRISNLVDV